MFKHDYLATFVRNRLMFEGYTEPDELGPAAEYMITYIAENQPDLDLNEPVIDQWYKDKGPMYHANQVVKDKDWNKGLKKFDKKVQYKGRKKNLILEVLRGNPDMTIEQVADLTFKDLVVKYETEQAQIEQIEADIKTYFKNTKEAKAS